MHLSTVSLKQKSSNLLQSPSLRPLPGSPRSQLRPTPTSSSHMLERNGGQSCPKLGCSVSGKLTSLSLVVLSHNERYAFVLQGTAMHNMTLWPLLAMETWIPSDISAAMHKCVKPWLVLHTDGKLPLQV